jgi:hypothetical protein
VLVAAKANIDLISARKQGRKRTDAADEPLF